jgi:hypothetical protein
MLCLCCASPVSEKSTLKPTGLRPLRLESSSTQPSPRRNGGRRAADRFYREAFLVLTTSGWCSSPLLFLCLLPSRVVSSDCLFLVPSPLRPQRSSTNLIMALSAVRHALTNQGSLTVSAGSAGSSLALVCLGSRQPSNSSASSAPWMFSFGMALLAPAVEGFPLTRGIQRTR